jgi:hypothetical protein
VGEEGKGNGRPRTLFYFSRTYVIHCLGTPQNCIKICTPPQCCTHICLLHRMSPRSHKTCRVLVERFYVTCSVITA